MDKPVAARNEESRQRLRALVGRLSTPDFARPVGGDWTVATTLAHLAFWDRFTLARWDQVVRVGVTLPEPLPDGLADLINEAALEQWQTLAPQDAAQAVLDAAARLDDAIAALPETSVKAALDARTIRLVDRSKHRLEHLEQIERALSG